MMCRIRSFAVTPGRSLPVTLIANDFGLRCSRHCVASTWPTSVVPMPNASAPNAPCVAVWESPQTIVMPGWVAPSSGPMTWTMPWWALCMPCRGMPCSAQLRSSRSTWALAFGIGTSEVEHVLATQTLLQRRPRTFEVRVEGRLAAGVTAKDVILALLAEIGVGAGTGHVFEYRGPAIRALSMEQRMTIC